MNEEVLEKIQSLRENNNIENILSVIENVDDFEDDGRWRIILTGVNRLTELEYDKILDLLLALCLNRQSNY